MLSVISSNAPIFEAPSYGFSWSFVIVAVGLVALGAFIIKDMRQADKPEGVKRPTLSKIGMTLSLAIATFGLFSGSLPAFSVSEKLESSSVEETAKIRNFIQDKYDLTILSDNVFEFVDATNDGYQMIGNSLWPVNSEPSHFAIQNMIFVQDSEGNVQPASIIVSANRTDLTLISLKDKEDSAESNEIPVAEK